MGTVKKLPVTEKPKPSKALDVGRRVLAGLQKAKATRRQNIAVMQAARWPVILHHYLRIKMGDPSGYRSKWCIAGLVKWELHKKKTFLSQRQVYRIIDMIPAASKNTCYFTSIHLEG